MFRANPEPKDLIPELDALAAAATSARELMTGIVGLLHKNLLKYNWVGFYMIEKEPAEDMLILGPFKGSMTPHTRIRLNQGICGAAASSGETVIVDDVRHRLAIFSLLRGNQIRDRRACLCRREPSSANWTSTAISAPPLPPKTKSYASTPRNSWAPGSNLTLNG
jgi:hypothetical protein